MTGNRSVCCMQVHTPQLRERLSPWLQLAEQSGKIEFVLELSKFTRNDDKK
jgi:hypothetical protein